jgi:hypothetical protein
MAFDDIPKYIQINNTFEPNPENRKIYDRLFAEFVNIYKRNKAIFKRLNSTTEVSHFFITAGSGAAGAAWCNL